MNQKDSIISLVCLLTIIFFINFKQAFSDPEIQLINNGCSQYNVTDVSNFYANLNATFASLRAELDGGGRKLFATAQKPTGPSPAYAMVQCRNYLSPDDCVACYTAAESLIRNCSASNGARVVYLGCFLRYESSQFYDQSTQEGRFGFCGNATALHAAAFSVAVKELVENLQAATPGMDGFFAASKKDVVGGGGNATAVYGVAQCVETISESGCRDCLATAYDNIQRCFSNAFGWAVDVGCFLRYSDAPFFADNQTTSLAPFLKNGNSSKTKAIIGVVCGGISLVLISIFFIWFKFYGRRKTKTTQKGNLLDATEFQGPTNYRYKDLISATSSFSEDNKLGEGGFGDIYKGTLANGKIVAVKRLAIGVSKRVVSDFENEVKLISNVHHRNLIRLLGCCSRGPDLLLVYEYMAKSSLDRFLFGEKRGSLNWRQRFDIILGTARGLAYLHEDFHVCIIHRDIKPSNILLDEDFQPKIADFGLARLLPEDRTHLDTKFAGTLGYTAPEYAMHGQLSVKVDAYSYGVVVLEIISGRKCTDHSKDTDEYLLKQAWKLHDNERHKELVDETMDTSEYEEEEVKKMIEIALMCTQSNAASRPTMSEVVVLLKSKGIQEQNTPVSPPTFFDIDIIKVREETSTSTASLASNATVSILQLSAR